MYDHGQGTPNVEQPNAARRILIGYLSTIDFDPGRADGVRLAEVLNDIF
jgi:hypothetical protein